MESEWMRAVLRFSSKIHWIKSYNLCTTIIGRTNRTDGHQYRMNTHSQSAVSQCCLMYAMAILWLQISRATSNESENSLKNAMQNNLIQALCLLCSPINCNCCFGFFNFDRSLYQTVSTFVFFPLLKRIFCRLLVDFLKTLIRVFLPHRLETRIESVCIAVYAMTRVCVFVFSNLLSF